MNYALLEVFCGVELHYKAMLGLSKSYEIAIFLYNISSWRILDLLSVLSKIFMWNIGTSYEMINKIINIEIRSL